jgi:hypothetical protein
MASVYQEPTQSELLSALEEHLDNLLKIRDEGDTAYREALIFDKYTDSDDNSETFPGCHLGLTITSMPQGWFVYWKGMEPSKLLKYDSCLVVVTQELPFQVGKPLSTSTVMMTNQEESTMMNYLRTSAPTSAWQMPLKMKTRSIEELEDQACQA